MTLYTYATSPYGAKVYWALAYKRIAFSIVYVNPLNPQQIRFTRQRVVPVVKVESEWRLDSGPICLWLEELFPSPSFAGADTTQREAILAADKWVTNNLIALAFRTFVDPDRRREAYYGGKKLVEILRRTSGSMPPLIDYAWSTILGRVGFIRRDAAMTDLGKTYVQMRNEILEQFEDRLASTGFLAGTSAPSYADLAAFAQIVTVTQLGDEGGIHVSSSPAVKAWFRRIVHAFPERIETPLVKGFSPFVQDADGNLEVRRWLSGSERLRARLLDALR